MNFLIGPQTPWTTQFRFPAAPTPFVSFGQSAMPGLGHFGMLTQLLGALAQMQNAWQGFGGGQPPQGFLPGPATGIPQPAASANPSNVSPGGARQLGDGTFVDTIGRQGKPVFGRNGELRYVKAEWKDLQAYEKESKSILRTWNMKDLPGEPMLGPRGENDYIAWAEKYLPGGFSQYAFNRSNSHTGVEDHEQLRGLLAKSRGVSPEQVDYREVMVMYALGEHGLKYRSEATQKIWRDDPPGTPLAPRAGLETWRKQDWEALWDLAPATKPPNWTWPADWEPKGRG